MKKIISFISGLMLVYTCVNGQVSVMKVDGIAGESARFKDKTELVAYVMEGTSTQAIAGGGGMLAGKRSYQPVTVVKQTGTISPLLLQHLFMGKNIKEIIIEYYKKDKTGKDALEYTLTFRNVVISGFKQFTATTKNEGFSIALNNITYDEIKFIFQEIIMDYKKVNLVVQDNISR